MPNEPGPAEFQELPITRYTPGDITLQCTTAKPGVAVLSQAWHPDWKITDNGHPLELRRVNYGFMGFAVKCRQFAPCLCSSEKRGYFACPLPHAFTQVKRNNPNQRMGLSNRMRGWFRACAPLRVRYSGWWWCVR
ncbi:MAG TPA: hypothetical protein PLI09_12465 [Candidatus Hydrogenedentes bacterium]|nr:hypothetical protein [Candidatus Hydrogenedentota bacterium]